MDKFEKLAQQIDDIGEVLCVPGVAEALEEISEEKNVIRQRGKLLRCTADCVRNAHDAVCRIMAIDGEKTLEEVEAMSDMELTSGFMRVMNTVLVPFVSFDGTAEKKK